MRTSPVKTNESLSWHWTAKATLYACLTFFSVLFFLPLVHAGSELFLVEGKFSFANFEVVLLNQRQWTLLGNSLFVSGTSALLALVIGIPFGFLMARARLPLKWIFYTLGIAPLAIPPLLSAIAWVKLIDLRGPLAAIFIFTISYFPFVWILVARSLENVDRRIEESARSCGGWKAAARAQWPFALPSACIGALLVFAFSIADFSVPDYLSTIGPKFNVYADDIFFRWKQEAKTGEAIAAALPALALLIAALCAIIYLRRKKMPSLTPGFLSPETLSLGKYTKFAWLFCAIVVGLSTIAPLSRLAWEAGDFRSYAEVLSGEGTGAVEDLANSLWIAAAAALSASLLQILPALFANRSRAGFCIDFLTTLPFMLPAMLLSIGTIRAWNHSGPILDWGEWVYGTKLVVVILFVLRFSAFSYFANSEGLRTISPSLEEAASIASVPWWARLRRILLPLIWPSVCAGALLVYLFSMREIDAVALIPSGNSTAMFRIYNYIHFGRDSFIAALCLIYLLCASLPLIAYFLLTERKDR